MPNALEQLHKDVDRLQARVEILEKAKDAFPDGVNGRVVTYTSGPTANGEDAVDHPLKKKPSYFIVLDKAAAVDLYRGTTPWTSGKLFLRCPTPGTAFTLAVF